jgi:hypothetical protein
VRATASASTTELGKVSKKDLRELADTFLTT